MSSLDSEALLAQLSDLEFYSECHVRESVTSTFDWLSELDDAGAPHGTIVIAERQTAGRGRRGRSWESPKGGAWFGILLRPEFNIELSSCLSIIAAVGLRKGIEAEYNLPVKIKWPNDLLLFDKKLCGILSELKTRGSAIHSIHMGMGINVNNSVPTTARLDAISVADVIGYGIDIQEFYGIVLRSFAKTYVRFLAEGFQPIISEWEQYSALGERVWIERTEGPVEAKVLGISELGRLIVELNGKTEELIAEDVTLSLSEH